VTALCQDEEVGLHWTGGWVDCSGLGAEWTAVDWRLSGLQRELSLPST
jgi:hypothetical protein